MGTRLASWIPIGIGIAFVLLGTTGSAEEVPSPVTAVDGYHAIVERVVTSGKDVDAMREDIKGEMESFVDYTELARLTIKSVWPTFSPTEKTEFVGLVKKRIEANYAKKFSPDSSLKAVHRGEPRLKKGRAKVGTTVTSGRITADVDYKLHVPEGKDTWWVYDIVIDDVSMVRNYRTQFKAFLADGGKANLFKVLAETSSK